MKTIKVKDYPGLVRDFTSKAIINIDQDAYKEHKAKKTMHHKVIALEQQMNEVKTSLDQIKELILQIKNQ